MSGQPLAEVFGFPIDNLSDEAEYYRKNRLCPYNNKVPSCTKDKANDPLGVCSVFEGEKIAITCPTRFNQNWLALGEAAQFFFDPDAKWTALREVPLKDRNGRSAGNIDFVLVRVDDENKIMDFGSVEVQAVYISGNVRKPFEYYMSDRIGHKNMTWKSTNVRPDYLSSSRKRLAPQLIYKGGILKAWGKKQAVVLHETFLETLPTLKQVTVEEAEVAWLIFGLDYDNIHKKYNLVHRRTLYTLFEPALESIITPLPGSVDEFIHVLQEKLDEKQNNEYPPDISMPNALLFQEE